MKDKSLIIGTDKCGNEIDIETVEQWLTDVKRNKIELADLVYYRLYNRYIKPFEFNDSVYKSEYKSGFAIMASSCLLIETFVSFTVREFISTYRKSERCFGYFFTTEERFKNFSQGGLTPSEYKDTAIEINGKGIPKRFYSDVRCGILHNGETRKTWRIRRDSDKILTITKNSKLINATIFLSEMKEVLNDYHRKLKISDADSELWSVCKARLENIIRKS